MNAIIAVLFLPGVLAVNWTTVNNSPKPGEEVVLVCNININPGTFAHISNKNNSAPLGSCDPDGDCVVSSPYSFSSNSTGVTVVILSFNPDNDIFPWKCEHDGVADFFTFQSACSSASIGPGLALGNAVLCGIAIFMLYMLILHLLCG